MGYFEDLTKVFDVVLMEYPDHMQPLDEFLEKACMEGDKERIRKLLTEFCQMAVWLINDNLVHGAIRASNVMIDKDCSVHLVNYEYMQMPRSDAPDYESIRDADNVMVANLALGIKAVASDPAAFRYLRGNAIFRFPVVRSPLLPMFADVAREAGCEPVLRIVEMLSCSNHTLHGRLALSEALRKLAGDRTELGVDLSVKLANERKPSAAEPDDSDARREEYLLNRTQLQSFYCWVGPVCESLICVRKGDLWGYVDCSGGARRGHAQRLLRVNRQNRKGDPAGDLRIGRMEQRARNRQSRLRRAFRIMRPRRERVGSVYLPLDGRHRERFDSGLFRKTLRLYPSGRDGRYPVPL